jgi:DnaJ-class molecular chaperone
MSDKDIRLDLDKPFEEEAQNVVDIPQPEPAETADPKKNAEPDKQPTKCEACNGTGLADYINGKEAKLLCAVCNGSGFSI